MKAEALRRARVLGTGAVVLVCAVGCKKEPPPAPPAATAAPPAASASAAPSASATGGDAPTSAGDSAGVTRLTADVGVGDELGYAVATAGERVVVTCYKRKGKTEEARPGSVFVYKTSGGKLEKESELSVDGSHQLGNSVAFDGSALLVGALYDNGKSPETGAAYAFTVDDKGWSKAEKLAPGDAKKDDAFGIGVALAGSTLVATNSRENGGSVYTFERGKTGLAAKQVLPFRHQNGPAEMIAAAGDVVAVGAPYSGKLADQGVVFVYKRDKTGLKQQAELFETDAGETRHFGSSLAVGKSTLVVTSEAQLSVFSESDGTWKESARITPPVTTGLADASLALGDDVLAVGFHLVEAGRVLLYRKRDGAWKLDRTVTAPDGKNEDWFGYSLALSPGRLVIGAPLAAERTGAAYVLSF